MLLKGHDICQFMNHIRVSYNIDIYRFDMFYPSMYCSNSGLARYDITQAMWRDTT